jgi:hypothetical protein
MLRIALWAGWNVIYSRNVMRHKIWKFMESPPSVAAKKIIFWNVVDKTLEVT